MSLKDNFNQAVKEILRRDGLVGDDTPKEPKKKTSELERYLEPSKKAQEETPAAGEFAYEDESSGEESAAGDSFSPENSDYSESPYLRPEQNVSQFGANPAPQPQSARTPASGGSPVQGGIAEPEPGISPFTQYSQYARQSGAVSGAGDIRGTSAPPQYDSRTASYGGGATPPPPPPPPKPRVPSYRGNEPDSPYYDTEETTVISRNTIVDGNIRSFANINIDGSVKGDVKITKNISVTGKVVGDIECNNSTMAGASMQGNIASKGQVLLDRDSLLLGDITAQYLDLNGKVKGNVDVGGKAEFKTDAVILGNITASTITVLDGATIQGYVNTTFLQESSSSIFPEAIALSE